MRHVLAVGLAGALLISMPRAWAQLEVVTTPGPTLQFEGTRSNPISMAQAGQFLTSTRAANPCAQGARRETVWPVPLAPVPISLARCTPDAEIVMSFLDGDVLDFNPLLKSYTYRSPVGIGWVIPRTLAMVRTTVQDNSLNGWQPAIQYKLPRYFYFFRGRAVVVNPEEEFSTFGRVGDTARREATSAPSYVDLGQPVSWMPVGPANKVPRIHSARIIKTPASIPAPPLKMTACDQGQQQCQRLIFAPTVPGTYIVEYRLYDVGLGVGSAGYIGYWTHTANLEIPFPGF